MNKMYKSLYSDNNDLFFHNKKNNISEVINDLIQTVNEPDINIFNHNYYQINLENINILDIRDLKKILDTIKVSTIGNNKNAIYISVHRWLNENILPKNKKDIIKNNDNIIKLIDYLINLYNSKIKKQKKSYLSMVTTPTDTYDKSYLSNNKIKPSDSYQTIQLMSSHLISIIKLYEDMDADNRDKLKLMLNNIQNTSDLFINNKSLDEEKSLDGELVDDKQYNNIKKYIDELFDEKIKLLGGDDFFKTKTLATCNNNIKDNISDFLIKYYNFLWEVNVVDKSNILDKIKHSSKKMEIGVINHFINETNTVINEIHKYSFSKEKDHDRQKFIDIINNNNNCRVNGVINYMFGGQLELLLNKLIPLVKNLIIPFLIDTLSKFKKINPIIIYKQYSKIKKNIKRFEEQQTIVLSMIANIKLIREEFLDKKNVKYEKYEMIMVGGNSNFNIAENPQTIIIQELFNNLVNRLSMFNKTISHNDKIQINKLLENMDILESELINILNNISNNNNNITSLVIQKNKIVYKLSKLYILAITYINNTEQLLNNPYDNTIMIS